MYSAFNGHSDADGIVNALSFYNFVERGNSTYLGSEAPLLFV